MLDAIFRRRDWMVQRVVLLSRLKAVFLLSFSAGNICIDYLLFYFKLYWIRSLGFGSMEWLVHLRICLDLNPDPYKQRCWREMRKESSQIIYITYNHLDLCMYHFVFLFICIYRVIDLYYF